MKKKIAAVFLVISLMLSLIYSENLYVKAENSVEETDNLDISDYKGKSFITVLKKGSENILYDLSGYTSIEELTDDIYVVTMEDNVQVCEAVKILYNNKHIEYIQPDYEYTETGILSEQSVALSSSYQWAYYNDGTQRIYDGIKGRYISGKQGININVVPAWEYIKDKESKEVIVAVVDTGTDYTHSSLSDNIWINSDEIAGDGIDNDGNGYIDDINGWNFYDENAQIFSYAKARMEYEDDHGTHCSGTIAASDRLNTQVAGIAGNSNIKLMCLKALGGNNSGEKYFGNTSSVTKAIIYAEKNGASVCNLSLGGKREDKVLKSIMQKSNMLFICASGNEGENTDLNPIYPACSNIDNIISVANLNIDGTLNLSSNYGEDTVDIAAPGTSILSLGVNNRFVYLTGTSMSAPMVTGAAALIYSYCEGMNSQRVKNKLLNSVQNLNSLSNKVSSNGMLDVYAALALDVEAPEIQTQINYSVNEGIINVKAEDVGDSGLKTVKWEYGRKTAGYFSAGTKGKDIGEDSFITVDKSGDYTVYACDNSGNEHITVVNIKIGNKPVIKTSLKSINNSNSKKMIISVSDVDENLKYVRYAEGIKTAAYFKEGTAGKKVNLTEGEAVVTISKTGNYTVYAIDKTGNEVIYKRKITISAPTKVTVNKTALTLKKGKTYTLKPSVYPLGVYTKLIYKSSNTSVASVSSKGKITAKNKGKATITIKTSNNKTVKCVVTVK